MKIQNIFTNAVVDKDNDERLVANGTIVDAENCTSLTTEGSNFGVLKNIPGNVKKTSYNIQGGKTVGKGKDESKEKVYDFIKGATHDYIIEYDLTTNTSERVLQDVSGGVLNFIEGERILNVDVISSGEVNGDLLAWSGDSNPPRIVNIAKAKTWAISGFTEVDISVMKPSPIFAPTVTPEQISTNDLAGFVRDKFLSFSYRYKYEDGFYSAFSSWSPYLFIPGILDIDVLTSTNISMQNNARAFNVNFNTGPRSVTDVEILFKVSNSTNVYSIIKLNKEEEGLGDNVNSSYLFDSYKVHKIIPEEQFFRNFDNVPLNTFCQSIIGNRLAYANYLEGRNIDNPVDFTVSYDSVLANAYEVDEIESIELDATETNVIDFWGESDEPVIGLGAGVEMDYETNIVTFTNVTAGNRYFRFNPRIFKEDTFSQFVLYFDIYVDGVVFYTGTIPSGVLSFSGSLLIDNTLFPPATVKEVYIVVRSEEPILYRCQLLCGLQNDGGGIESLLSFDTNDYFLISKPNTIDSDEEEGNVIPLSKLDLDMSGFSFSNGSNYLFDFDIVLAYLFNTALLDSYTFDYSVNGDYTDFTDFIDNSNFITSFEAFFDNLVNNPLNQIPSSSIVSFTPANIQINYLNESINIEMPIRIISAEEPSGLTLEKTDYLLCKSVSVRFSSTTLFVSMHSSRDYEIGIVFLDEQGRKTTVIDSKTNNLYIQAENSITQNTIVVDMVGTPPTWAKYYKFAVRYNKSKYETIYASEIYNDFIYSYIKLVADNKNKIKEGDYVVIKADLTGPLASYVKVKVLELKEYELDEITEGSTSGFYFKIKNGNFNLELDDNDFLEFIGNQGEFLNAYFVASKKITYNDGTDISFVQGNTVRFVSYCNRQGSNSFNNSIDQKYYLSASYADFREMFEAVIAPSQPFLDYIEGEDMELQYRWEDGGTSRNQISFRPRTSRDGQRYIRTKTDVYITTSQLPIFETVPLDVFDSSYVETSKTYTITDGNYQFVTHRLTDLFNCYCFGNGAESISVRDEMTTSYLNIDYSLNAVSEDEYKQIRRFADITYSGIFNPNTNVNRLNEFNLSLANFKEDIEKIYGPIIKIKGQDTNLEVYQEDKVSKVMYEKDVLFNADGTSNVARIEQVLGQQVPDGGEYGISEHPDSFDEYGFNSYFTDTKRGVVMKKNFNNGLFEISSQGMTNYFRKLFRENQIIQIHGKYDQYHDHYLLNIQYRDKNDVLNFVTWAYSDRHNGWLMKESFNPEDMIRVNNHLVSFKNGEIYLHNQEFDDLGNDNYNTFYGVRYPSKVRFNLSQEPSIRKNFKTLFIEGSDPWKIDCATDLDKGYIQQSQFDKKEGVFYAYIRTSNEILDTQLNSVQGIGNCTIAANVLNFSFELPSEISVGDVIRNTALEIVGTVTDKTNNSLTLNSVSNLSSGDYVLSTKPQSVQNNSLTGYYMMVDMEIDKASKTEVFSVGSEINQSHM